MRIHDRRFYWVLPGALLLAACATDLKATENTEKTGRPGPDGGRCRGDADPPLVPPAPGDAGGGSAADAGAPPPDAGTSMDAGAADASAGEDAGGATEGLRLAEVDYDQPGVDTAEFVELLNAGGSERALEGWVLVLVNGHDGRAYGRIDLSGTVPPGGRVLVAPADLAAPPVAVRVEASDGFLQNGPDAVALLNGDGELVDALVYEGPVRWERAAEGGVVEPLPPPAGAQDDGPGSLVRPEGGEGLGNGWRWSEQPTPGASNGETG
ncbi:MAG: lamin tail domain-containing protein [Myxococcota bacterium]